MQSVMLIAGLVAGTQICSSQDEFHPFLLTASQAYESASSLFQGLFLNKLYGNQGNLILAELNLCLENNATSQVSLNQANFEAFQLSCQQDDPLAPGNKLIQDAIISLANWANPCRDLPVDLSSDLDILMARSILQGNDLIAPIFGLSSKFIAPILQQFPEIIKRFLVLAVAAAQASGATSTVDAINTDFGAEQRAVEDALREAGRNVLSEEDVTTLVNLGRKLASDEGKLELETVESLMKYADNYAVIICNLV